VIVVLESEQPLHPSTRHVLDEASTLVIGRGADRHLDRTGGSELRLDMVDPWMSVSHARLDLGSKNGTLVNGRCVARAMLGDGDLVEVGRTLLVFRHSPWLDDALDVAETDAEVAGLTTLHADYAAVLRELPAVARSRLPVLICGETGTGKELVARAIHELSHRHGPLVAVNCGAIPPTLIESELFGHRRGAFSGALQDRLGLVRAADGGTLLLDEIGDLPLPSQAALLRVLQEREVRAIGDTSSHRVDVRIVAATHRDLDAMVSREQFRQDLLARLQGARFVVPPLRARREDIGLLFRRFLGAESGDASSAALSLTAARALLHYGWPLNVRELEQCVSLARVRAAGELIDAPHLPAPVAAAAVSPIDPTADAAANFGSRRRAEVVALLRAHGGNLSSVARALGTTRVQIHRWARRYCIDLNSFRS
jgi:transcriptional regulator with GAF, ATPase, and Fis domain